MVENKLNNYNYGSLTELKKSLQNEKIINKIIEEYKKSPIGQEPTRKDLSKKFKVSENTISMAFDDIANAAKKENFDATKLLMKGLGLATPLVLLSEDNLSRVSNFIGDNPKLTGIGSAAFLFWQQWLKPRINDPKNDLSEIEVMTELLTSQTGAAAITSIFGFLAYEQIKPMIEDIATSITLFGAFIRDGLINFGKSAEEIAEDIEKTVTGQTGAAAEGVLQEFLGDEVFKNHELHCFENGIDVKTFPTYEDWLLQQSPLKQYLYAGLSNVSAPNLSLSILAPISPFLAYSEYKNEKLAFIEECGRENIKTKEQIRREADQRQYDDEIIRRPEESKMEEPPEELTLEQEENIIKEMQDALKEEPPQPQDPYDDEIIRRAKNAKKEEEEEQQQTKTDDELVAEAEEKAKKAAEEAAKKEAENIGLK